LRRWQATFFAGWLPLVEAVDLSMSLTADGVLNLAFNLVGFSFGFELGIARRLAGHLLD
jgi:hypothetical protein